jgi:hypothetical protein
MTAEICVANRRALVLAADSAATVSQWQDGAAKERYYKGANKIFHFSGSEPVGIMIYDTAAIHLVPWETIIKDCRQKRGNLAFKTIDEYAKDLFDFVESKLAHVFTPQVRRDAFVGMVFHQMFQLIRLFNEEPTVKAATTQADLQVALNNLVGARLPPLRIATVPDGVSAADVTKAVHEIVPVFVADFAGINYLHPIGTPKIVDLFPNGVADFWELVIRVVYQRYRELAPMTGVVVAGFGADEYFPSYVHYGCYGFLNDRLVVRKMTADVNIGGADISKIEAFAQTDMAETFMIGMAPEVLSFVSEATNECLATATADLEKVGAVLPADWKNRLAEIEKEHRTKWVQKAMDRHWRPLSEVVGSLPLEDMATLAETLVALTSLKERVTRGTETVGGAIDVAVLTRGDGFVWVKRKHYFDPALNPRYFSRIQS